MGHRTVATAPGQPRKDVTLTDVELLQIAEDELAFERETRANAYKESRRKGYGSVEDQLDLMYHQGFRAWKDHIRAVKLAHPKPENDYYG